MSREFCPGHHHKIFTNILKTLKELGKIFMRNMRTLNIREAPGLGGTRGPSTGSVQNIINALSQHCH